MLFAHRRLLIAGFMLASGCASGASVTAEAEGSMPTVPASTSSIPSPPPEPASPETPAPAHQRRRLVVHGTGDVNLDPSYIPALASEGYAYPWARLEGLFTHDHLTIVNLECAVSDLGAPLPKEFTFRCDPDALPEARAAGVDVANLANNHGGDYGPEAWMDSVHNVRAAGIAPVGVGRDAQEAAEPAVITVRGWTIAVLGFGGVVPFADWLAGPHTPGMASGDDTTAMAAAVSAAGEAADLVFVTMHWGAELDTRPRAEDVDRAHAMIDAGADAIFGHHAHRLQPLTWYRDRPIAWGLGNFVWPNISEAGSRTAIAEVVVDADGTIGACLIPAFIHRPGQPILTAGYQGPCSPTPDMERPELR